MPKNENYLRKLLIFLSLFLVILFVSINGYMQIEGWDFFDSLYMTIITLATIGYGETHQLSFWGRLHTMFVIITGVGFFSTMVIYLSSLLVENDFRNYLVLRAKMKKINKLENHYIVCGYGRIGREVCLELRSRKIENIVIIDRSPTILKEAQENGFLVFEGDATEDETLLAVGIKNANSIICALTDDALNVFITLSSRVLNPNIKIISRTDHEESVEKLKRAGADIVVAPYIIGGKRIASAITHPLVLDFLDTILHDHEYDLNIEEIKIKSKSSLDGVSISTSNIRSKSGAVIIAVKKTDGTFISNPIPEYILNANEILLALGNTEQLEILEKMAI
ncbi:MAG: NAD-binding protein [Candidatus Sericytochromatia bacterium]